MIRSILITPLNAVLVAAILGFTSAGFLLIPEGTVMPVHWGPGGQPDGFADRNMALLMAPAVALVLIGVFVAIVRFSRSDAIEAGQHAIAVALSALLGLFAIIQAIMLQLGIGHPADMPRAITLGFAIMLIAIGNVAPKTQPNNMVGIRLPWLMNDAALWQHTHRLVGLLHVGAGVLLLALAFAPVPPLAHFGGILAATFVPLAIGAVDSYRRSRRGLA